MTQKLAPASWSGGCEASHQVKLAGGAGAALLVGGQQIAHPTHIPRIPLAGHSSWAGAGLGFFSFWIVGWLGCFRSTDRAQPLQLLLGLLPLAGALAIGCQRVVADK